MQTSSAPRGIAEPISHPMTKTAPTKPRAIPVHCKDVMRSRRRGPASKATITGCSEAISAATVAGMPWLKAQNTPPR